MNRISKFVLGSATVIVVIMIAFPVPKPTTGTTSSVVAIPAPVVQRAPGETVRMATQEQLAAQELRSTLVVWGRDPFAPPAPPEQPPQQLVEPAPMEPIEIAAQAAPVAPLPPTPEPRPQLSGVIRGTTKSWALIDGELVQEGDSLSSGHLVARISTRSVTVLRNDEEMTLKLGEEQ